MSAVEQLYAAIENPRRRRKPPAGPSEHQIHAAVIEHLRRRAVPGLVWWHTPNDGKRSPGTAKRLQQMGMRKGVSDLCLLYRGNFYAIEFKSLNGRPTVEQMQFTSDVNAAGGHATICHDLDRALRCLECWGLIR